ncbi:MAG: hypothetical protein Q8K32_32360 [Archangium sp.]|nr:hypothetical protein [Archangium sp.]
MIGSVFVLVLTAAVSLLTNALDYYWKDGRTRKFKRLRVALVAVTLVLLACGVLVAWKSDEASEQEKKELRDRIGSLKAQLEEESVLAANRHKIIAAEQRTTLRKVDAQAMSTMIKELASESVEMRLGALEWAAEYVRAPEFRARATEVVIEAVGHRLREFSANSRLLPASIEPELRLAGAALKVSEDCEHLRSVINGLYARFELTGFDQPRLAVLPAAERGRRGQVLAILSRAIGHHLFCGFITYCANKVDLENSLEGRSLMLSGMGAQTFKNTIPPASLAGLNGKPHEAPEPRSLSGLVSSVPEMCGGPMLTAIAQKACSIEYLDPVANRRWKTQSCLMLSNMRVYEGGWVGISSPGLAPPKVTSPK